MDTINISCWTDQARRGNMVSAGRLGEPVSPPPAPRISRNRALDEPGARGSKVGGGRNGLELDLLRSSVVDGPRRVQRPERALLRAGGRASRNARGAGIEGAGDLRRLPGAHAVPSVGTPEP